MLSTGTTENKESDTFLNESDLLLADRYILAKEIKDLNKTLLDSKAKMNVLEDEVKNKLKLKAQLDTYQLALVPDANAGTQNVRIALLEECNQEPDFRELLESIKKESRDFNRIKQLLIDLSDKFAAEIEILLEKIKLRNEADSEVCLQRDNLTARINAIVEEISNHKPVEKKDLK